MKKREVYEDRYTTYWRESNDDTVFIKYTPELEITLPIAKDLVRSRLEYTKNQPHYTIIDFTNVLKVEKAARDYMNNPEFGLKNIIGGAFVSNSIIGVLFINLYLKINKPYVPAKFFQTREEAINYIQDLRQSNSIKTNES